jgi:Tol biopolymer transport system component
LIRRQPSQSDGGGISPPGPRLSRDGRRIAFFGNSSTGDAHLFVLDADGASLTPVTTAKGEMNVMPQWAAAGGQTP